MPARSYTKTEQVLTTLKPADRDRLDAYATENEISRAEAVRTILLSALTEIEEDEAERSFHAGEPVIPR